MGETMRKWMIAANLLALVAHVPAQAQDRALHEAIAADYRANLAGLFEHFHENPELSGREVNTAARMESHGVAGTVHVSEHTRSRLQAGFAIEARGPIEVKGKGSMATFLIRRDVHITTVASG